MLVCKTRRVSRKRCIRCNEATGTCKFLMISHLHIFVNNVTIVWIWHYRCTNCIDKDSFVYIKIVPLGAYKISVWVVVDVFIYVDVSANEVIAPTRNRTKFQIWEVERFFLRHSKLGLNCSEHCFAFYNRKRNVPTRNQARLLSYSLNS